MLQQKFIVQVTTLPDCDDITRFDGTHQVSKHWITDTDSNPALIFTGFQDAYKK